MEKLKFYVSKGLLSRTTAKDGGTDYKEENEEIHRKQQILDRIDYCIYELKTEE